MNRSKKRKNRLFPMLITVMVLTAVLTPAAYADTDGTEPKIVQQPDQLVLQLGTRWAGVEFELRTDAGIFPVPVVVDEYGVLTMDLGGSTTYTLSCIHSTAPIPDPESEQTDPPPPAVSDPVPEAPVSPQKEGQQMNLRRGERCFSFAWPQGLRGVPSAGQSGVPFSLKPTSAAGKPLRGLSGTMAF